VRSGSEGHREESYEINRIVCFNNEQGYIECNCMNFTKVGILCSHCLLVLNARYVDKVPDQYVVKRWCKRIKDGEFNVMEKYGCQQLMVCSSVWKSQMMRKMNSLIIVSQLNQKERANCEKYFNKLKELM